MNDPSTWWLLVDVELLLRLTAAAFFVVALGVCVVAAETANQIFASGPSAAGPGASPEADPPASGDVPSSLDAGRWAAGADAVFPSHASPGGPPTQT